MNIESDRKQEILNNLRKVISAVYEMDVNDVDIGATFLEMGLDSISIIQVRQLVKNTYEMDVSVNRLFDDIATLDTLADFINAALPVQEIMPTKILEKQNSERVVHVSADLPKIAKENHTENTSLQDIINFQLQIMGKQIEIMSRLKINL